MTKKKPQSAVEKTRELLRGANSTKTTEHDLTVEEKQTLLGFILNGASVEDAAGRVYKPVDQIRAYLRSAEASRVISASLSGHSVRLPLLALQFFEEVLGSKKGFPLAMKARVAEKVFDRLSDSLLPGADSGIGGNLEDMSVEQLQALQLQLEGSIQKLENQRADDAKEIK